MTFQVLTAASKKMTLLAPCSLVEAHGRFRGSKQGDCPDDGGSKNLLKVVSFCQTTLRNNPEESHLLQEL
jgi:hypothetical protein